MGFDPVWLIFLGVGLGIVPIFLMMATSYVKIVVVLLLVRNALGVQQIPPQMVINGLAMVLTVFIMAPVGYDTMALLEKETAGREAIAPTEVFAVAEKVSPPLRSTSSRSTPTNASRTCSSRPRSASGPKRCATR